ncbi:MAG: anthranilate synthase component I family protein [Melioribacteraceae bacterium]|nr:anthranilate synthase component I family protein [Melioribacteraceae bacterium]
MTFEEFQNLAKSYKQVPVFKTLPADLITPVSAFLNIRKSGNNPFLFESVEGIGNFARFSFLSKNPAKTFKNHGKIITVNENGSEYSFEGDFFEFIKNEKEKFNLAPIKELPDLTGGMVGFISYENISLVEDSISFRQKSELGIPDGYFGLYESIVVFDHFTHQIIIIKNVTIDSEPSLESQYESALEEIGRMQSDIFSNQAVTESFRLTDDIRTNIDENFTEIIESCKKNIFEGDVFQIVYSKQFSTSYEGDVFNIYRSLRIINPSPYMYFLDFEKDFQIIGTSPEDLLQVHGKRATILPIAGTRKRGNTPEKDLELENELLNDPKEIAEHTMLVDLARNDLGRVCDFESIKITEDKRISKFSHVMHIVSRVEGNLKNDKDCIDALRASFPAGTVTGAPKIRAIQLLEEYEKTRRNIYAGAIGYIDFHGNLDLCIAIRTLFTKADKIYWQAGAGIVADSKPELEAKEIQNKAAVLINALRFAEELG